jgi:hypothetical protein
MVLPLFGRVRQSGQCLLRRSLVVFMLGAAVNLRSDQRSLPSLLATTPGKSTRADEGVSPPVCIRARNVRVALDAVELEGEVRLRRGDLTLRAPRARIHGPLQHPEELEMPELSAEWISPQGQVCHLDCPGQTAVRLQEQTATIQSRFGERVRWQDQDRVIEAHNANLRFGASDWALELVELEGDVRLLQVGGSAGLSVAQAWAQRAQVSLPSRHIVLEADQPQRVTLWNRQTTQELACRRLHIWQDAVTQEWMQRGEGEVTVRLAADEVQRMAKPAPPTDEELEEDD